MNKRVISINAGKKAFTLEKVNHPGIIGPIDYALYEHETKKTHLLDPLDENTPFIFGSGPLAGSIIPGTHRLVFAGRSPLTKTFYMSTLGGAALPISKIQADFIKITGRAE
ncbi:MAG: glyceraldehyde-3-phosphate:ferredoxin oxidoreductase, partial [Candidatus Aenigmarchaeota archaeon]|nr:glyceraldehyde-3-phosphate:ferredoxin oxidoreductase [Candidatus Aenigmarchaeota archaeon]MCK5334405.1 glyceraldehyde-3-phosphate:ferredoxin oxidoreductase [Candidatus Aenigmarchaeota archaeon]